MMNQLLKNTLKIVRLSILLLLASIAVPTIIFIRLDDNAQLLIGKRNLNNLLNEAARLKRTSVDRNKVIYHSLIRITKCFH